MDNLGGVGWSRHVRAVWLWRAVPVITIRFLEQAGFFLLFLFLTQRYLAEDRGLGVAFAGYAITVFAATKLLAQTPAGWVGDRIGYKRSLMLGLAASLAAVVVMMTVHQAWALLATTAVFALGRAPASPAMEATVANLYEERARGKVVALMNAGAMAAYAVAGLAGLLVLDLASAGTFFAVAIGLNAAPMVVAGLWLKETSGSAADPAPAHSRRPPFSALLSPQVVTWAGIVLLVGFGMGLAAPVARPYVRDVLDMELRELAPYLAAPAVLAALAIVPAGHLADRLGRVRPLALGLGLGAVGMLGVSFTASIWPLMALAAVIMISFTISSPAMAAALMDITEENTRGFVLGALGTAGGVGGALGPTVGGSIYASLSPQDVFFTAGFVLVGAMLLTVAFGGWRFVARPVAASDD